MLQGIAREENAHQSHKEMPLPAWRLDLGLPVPGVEELQASCTAGEGRQQCSSVGKPLGHFLISIVPTFHVLSRGAPGRPPERSLVGDSPRQNRSDVHRQVDRQTVVCPCAGTLLSSEQGPAPPTTCWASERRKPGREERVLRSCTHRKSGNCGSP